MSIDTGAGYGGNKIVCDMDEHGEMKSDAMSRAAMAIEQSTEEKAISRDIKGYMDLKYGPTWHCIVGSDFRAYVTHESKHFIFFYIGKTAICLYKAGWMEIEFPYLQAIDVVFTLQKPKRTLEVKEKLSIV